MFNYIIMHSSFLEILSSATAIDLLFAYIDPGSGSVIMSVIIGFFVAIGVLIKNFWYKITALLGLSKNKKKPSIGEAKPFHKGKNNNQ